MKNLERVSEQAAGGAHQLAGVSNQTATRIAELGDVVGKFRRGEAIAA